MLKSLVLICVSFLFLVSCGEDSPVNQNIIKNDSCINKVFQETTEEIFYFNDENDFSNGINFEISDYMPKNYDIIQAFRETEYKQFKEINIKFGKKNQYVINLDKNSFNTYMDNYLKTKNYYHKSYRGIDGNEYEIIIELNYYFTTNQFDDIVPVFKKFNFKYGRKDWDWEYHQDKSKEYFKFYLEDDPQIKLNFVYEKCLDIK